MKENNSFLFKDRYTSIEFRGMVKRLAITVDWQKHGRITWSLSKKEISELIGFLENELKNLK